MVLLHTKARPRADNKKPLQPKPEGSGSIVPVEYPKVSYADKDEVEAEGQKHGGLLLVVGGGVIPATLVCYRWDKTSIRCLSLRRFLIASLCFRLTMISTV